MLLDSDGSTICRFAASVAILMNVDATTEAMRQQFELRRQQEADQAAAQQASGLITLPMIGIAYSQSTGTLLGGSSATGWILGAIAWVVAAMWSSLNAASAADPRWPLVPKATCCAGSAGSG